MGLLASSKPIVNYLRCYQGLIHLYSTAVWRYLEKRSVRKPEGQSPKNLLNRKLIKGAYKDRGSQWRRNHTVLKGQTGRFAQWGLWCPYNTSKITQLILSLLILDKKRLQAAQYVTDARIALSSEGITMTKYNGGGSNVTYLIKNGNLSLKRCLFLGFMLTSYSQ